MNLCTTPLDAQERARLLGLLDALAGYLGAPGNWGYGTTLGKFAQAVLMVRNDVRATDPDAAEALLAEQMRELERLPDAPRAIDTLPPTNPPVRSP